MENLLSDKYSVLYKTLVSVISKNDVIQIPTSDIISYAVICNYDTMTYPILRLRLYTDLDIIQKICEYPDDIKVNMSLNGNVYRMSDGDTPVLVAGATSTNINLKGYIENKNIPSSVYDQYRDGKKIENDLNNNIKYPLEIYCYNYDLIHKSKSVVPSIYKNITIDTIISDIFNRIQSDPIEIEEIDNHTKYDQIIIPGLDTLDALTYLERYYGIYKKGTQIFCDIDKIYVNSIDTDHISSEIIPIYVTSYKNNSDLSGLRKSYNKGYNMFTRASNVSVKTETDIEKTLNGSFVTDLNVKEGELNYKDFDSRIKSDDIITKPNIIHAYNNDFVSEMIAARINERITRIDMSFTGFDVLKIKSNSRFNVIFESPIRGKNTNDFYRATFAAHVFTNLNTDLFMAESSFTLTTNTSS